MERKHTTITIPKPLYEKIKARIEATGFSSVSDYVTYVLRQLVSSYDEEKKREFSRRDEETVKKRLKALGYLD